MLLHLIRTRQPPRAPRRARRTAASVGVLGLVVLGAVALHVLGALLGLSAVATAAQPPPLPVPLAPSAPAPAPPIPLIPTPPDPNTTPFPWDTPTPPTPPAPPTGPAAPAPPPAPGTPTTPGAPNVPPNPLPPGLAELCKDPTAARLPLCFSGQQPMDPNIPSLVPPPSPYVPGSEYTVGSGGGVMPTMLGPGARDFSRFDIGYDPGNLIDTDKWDDRFFGMLTRLGFSIHTWLVSICSWMVEQAVNFSIADFLLSPVESIAQTWKTLIVDQLGLVGFAGLITTVIAGLIMLSGRVAAGVVELITSLVVGALVVLVLANPAAVLLGKNGLLGKTREFALQTAAVTLSNDVGQQGLRDSEIAAPLITGLSYAIVVQPHMILDWGRSLDGPQVTGIQALCLGIYKEIIRRGPHGTSDLPRDMMDAAGCDDLVKFNENAGPERLIGVMLVGFGALILIVVLALVSLTLALSQAVLAGLVIASPAALISAYLPRHGRGLLWWFCVSIVSAVLIIVLLLVGLAVLVKLIIGIFQASNSASLIMRFVVFDVIVVGGVLGHRKIKRLANRVSATVVHRLATKTNSGHSPSVAPWIAGGAGLATGLAMRRMVMEGRQEWRGVMRPVRRSIRYGRQQSRAASRTGRRLYRRLRGKKP